MIKKIFSIFVLAAFIFSCSSPTTEKQVNIEIPVEAEGSVQEMNKKLIESEENYDFILPSPLQIAAIFQRAGLNYVPEITNPISNNSNYNTEFKMAMNFGVYSADLSYNVLNNQSQKSIDYLNVVRDLSNKLGLSAIFETEPLLESFEANINNRDSIIYILSKLQKNLDLYLDENDVRYKSVIYFTGAWVEGMYIGAKSIDKRNRNAVANRLIEQLSLLENLIKGLKNYPKKTEEYNPVIAQLEQIGVQMDEISKTGVEQEDGSIKFDVTDDKLDSLTQKVSDLRTYLTKTN